MFADSVESAPHPMSILRVLTWSPCWSACRILRRYTTTSGELVETPQLVAVSLLLSALIRLVFVASSRATLRSK